MDHLRFIIKAPLPQQPVKYKKTPELGNRVNQQIKCGELAGGQWSCYCWCSVWGVANWSIVSEFDYWWSAAPPPPQRNINQSVIEMRGQYKLQTWFQVKSYKIPSKSAQTLTYHRHPVHRLLPYQGGQNIARTNNCPISTARSSRCSIKCPGRTADHRSMFVFMSALNTNPSYSCAIHGLAKQLT